MPDASDAVWLSVLPDMKNFGPGIVKEAGKEADKAGKTVGQKFGTAITVGVAAVATGAVAAGTALYKIGETFDEVTDTIRVGTGATGKDLDGLVASAKNVGNTVPAEFEQIGTVVADVNTRLGLTGPTLEKFSSQVLEAGRIMGEEIDINTVSAAFNAFQIQGEDTTGAMDHLYRVSQATGVGMNQLAANAARSAPALQALGFTFEETTALVGNLDKAGLDSGKMMAGMSRALVELAKDGEEPQDAFKRVTGEIQGFMAEGDKAAAIDLASQLFGTRNASQFIGALESGALAMDDLGTVAGMTEDTILGAGEETMDFAEQWQLFKNNILTTLEPLATRVFGAIGDGMSFIVNTVLPQFMAGWNGEGGPVSGFTRLGSAVQGATAWVKENWRVLAGLLGVVVAVRAAMAAYTAALAIYNGVQKAVTVATTIWSGVQKALNVVMAMNPIGLVIAILGLLVGAIVVAYQKSETFRAIVDGAWKGIKTAANAVWVFLRDVVFAGLKSAFGAVGQFFSDRWRDIKGYWESGKLALQLAWSWINVNVFAPLKAGIKVVADWIGQRVGDAKRSWDGLKSAFRAVWDWISTNVFDNFKRGLDKIVTWVSDTVTKVGNGWRNIANKFRSPINWVLETVWNGGIKKAFDGAARAIGSDKRLARANTIPAFAKGGLARRGWALVGEEGPELVNFQQPGRVYTARQTAAALGAGEGSEGGSGGGLRGAVDAVVGWVRGGLAKAAAAILDPVKRLIRGTVGQWGTYGGLAGDTATSAIDAVVKWIRGKDEEVDTATGGPLAMSGGWTRPSRGRISQRFGVPGVLSGIPHAGIDIAGGGPTYAAAAGKVIRAGWNILGGRSGIGILLQHAKDLFTYYGHNPIGGVRVKQGQDVKRGQRIGAQGATGNVTGTHLHFELHRGRIGRAVNPTQMGVFDGGGWLNPGMMAYHSPSMAKPDAVLSHSQWSDIHALAMNRVRDDGPRAVLLQVGEREFTGYMTEVADSRVSAALPSRRDVRQAGGSR